MTVKELILELSKFDPESLIVTYCGYSPCQHEEVPIVIVEQNQYYDWEKKQHVPSVRIS